MFLGSIQKLAYALKFLKVGHFSTDGIANFDLAS